MSSSTPIDISTAVTNNGLYKKIAWRIVPFVVVAYMVSFLDRINIGYAKLQMAGELGLSDAVYGIAAGIFSVGYILFEVPSNLLLVRYGARKTFVRIMFAWGLVSVAMMFVTQPVHVYVLRVLLGVAEAGLYPGLLLYFTYWFPREKYAGSVAWFSTASAAAGLFGGPLSGLIMNSMNGVWGLGGWRWLFLLEGIPAVLMGCIAYFYISDKPTTATWLTPDEKEKLSRDLASSYGGSSTKRSEVLSDAIRNPTLYLLALVYFTVTCAGYGLVFWLPSMIGATGVKSVLHIGILSALPYCVAIVAILLVSRRSDRTGDRRWHFLACGIVGAVGMLALISTIANGNVFFTMLWLCIAVAATFSMTPIFWATPPMFLGGTAAAGGLALISSIGQLAGFASPFVIGLTRTKSASFTGGLLLMAAVLIISGLLLAFTMPWERSKEVVHQTS
jgi:sugar phosphate permease